MAVTGEDFWMDELEYQLGRPLTPTSRDHLRSWLRAFAANVKRQQAEPPAPWKASYKAVRAEFDAYKAQQTERITALEQRIKELEAQPSITKSDGYEIICMDQATMAISPDTERILELEASLAHWQNCHGVTADKLVEVEAERDEQMRARSEWYDAALQAEARATRLLKGLTDIVNTFHTDEIYRIASEAIAQAAGEEAPA